MTLIKHILRCAALVAFLGFAVALVASDNAQADPLRTINEGELTVLMTPASPPTAFIRDGEPQGMAVDLMKEIAARNDLSVSFRAISEYAGIIPAVSNNQYDIAAVGMMRTPPRMEIVDFTSPWYYGWFPLLVEGSSPYSGYADMEGKIIGVVSSSIQERYMQENHPEIQLSTFPNDVGSVAALNAGSIDGALTGNALLKDTLERFPNLRVAARTPVPFPNAFPMNKDNPELRAAVNAAMAEMMADGTYVEIFDRWHKGDALPEPLYKDYPALANHRAPGVLSAED